jgi:hypothetical protein
LCFGNVFVFTSFYVLFFTPALGRPTTSPVDPNDQPLEGEAPDDASPCYDWGCKRGDPSF